MNAPGSAGHQPGSGESSSRAGARRSQERLQGWHHRGYLPHFDGSQTIQSITFRLADSLPQERLTVLETELATLTDSERDCERRVRIAAWLDAGMGCCCLRHPRLAEVMAESLHRFDGQRYRLLAWCIMPNHVHVLIEPTAPLATIVGSWKSFTGRWALAHNQELDLGIQGKTLWIREYWDRYIRDPRHFLNTRHYIEHNPVTAGLCATPQDWRWSSAFPGSAGHQPGSESGRADLDAGLVPGAPRNHP